MKALALAAALALPGAASADHTRLEVEYTPGYAWFLGPGTPSLSDGRIRVVILPGHGAAAMTLNQFGAYQNIYRLRLGEYGMDMPLPQAEARARHVAWHAVVEAARKNRVDQIVLVPLKPMPLRVLVSP
ncbi:hypothetical protein [Jannaschia formosa]|uniref:hypothetical protein n=1 Tax=Jannaschia formosa TaxID=2259592 RepID=UPI000E1BA2F3|nr:hypothetical protein [Jannaschia formosa]TFL16906.1 hypothetical protein DR046_17390 [Jannaschia formosa]